MQHVRKMAQRLTSAWNARRPDSTATSHAFGRIHPTAREAELARRWLGACPQAQGVNARVSDEDEIYMHLRRNLAAPELALATYFREGLEAIHVIQNVLACAGRTLESVASVLDFACGHGKSTRFLARRIAPERITACDIYRDAVEYQVREFGVLGAFSASMPSEMKLARRFDLIYVGSLFSHLPPDSFAQWLCFLHQALDDDGILILSTHGSQTEPLDREDTARGYAFRAASESRSLDKRQYGSMSITDRWFRALCTELELPVPAVLRRELWDQDLYVLGRRALFDESRPLQPNRHPLVMIEQSSLQPSGEFLLSGWAVDKAQGSPVPRLELLVDGQASFAATTGLERPDVASHYGRAEFARSGWVMRGAMPGTSAREAVVRAASSCGAETLMPVLLD